MGRPLRVLRRESNVGVWSLFQVLIRVQAHSQSLALGPSIITWKTAILVDRGLCPQLREFVNRVRFYLVTIDYDCWYFRSQNISHEARIYYGSAPVPNYLREWVTRLDLKLVYSVGLAFGAILFLPYKTPIFIDCSTDVDQLHAL